MKDILKELKNKSEVIRCMLQELTNKIKKTLKDKEWTRLSLLEHGLKEYPEGYEHYEDVDIILEDVLRCLERVKKIPSLYCINAFGDIFENYDNKNVLITKWQLGKPLHEQSDETIKELNKLI